MALSLLSQNRCTFGGCQLYFASIDDLIAHIEFVHISKWHILVISKWHILVPTNKLRSFWILAPLEDEYRQKVSQAQYGSEENRASATPNMPLSCVYRYIWFCQRCLSSKICCRDSRSVYYCFPLFLTSRKRFKSFYEVTKGVCYTIS